MRCKRSENKECCTCIIPMCPRKGICCECIKKHLKKRQMPACFFSKGDKKAISRPFKKFIEENS